MSLHPPQRSNLRRNVVIGFCVVAAMLAIMATVSVHSTKEFLRTSRFVGENHEAIELQERVLRDIMTMESSRRGYLVTGDERALRVYEDAQEEAIQSFNSLKSLLRSSPDHLKRLERLRALMGESFALQQAEIEMRRTNGAAAAEELFRQRKSEATAQNIRRLVVEAEGEQRELLARRSDGTENLGRAASTAVAAGGVLTVIALLSATFMLLRDLAARRRAEEALAQEHHLLFSIINALPVSVYVKDAKGRFILDNNAHRAFVGLDEMQSIEGKTAFEYFTPECARQLDTDDKGVVTSGAPMLNREELVQLKNETRETWIETNKVPLYDTDGKIVGLVGISSDINFRKESEEQLRRFAEQLERSNAELQNFASVASHDLQEPLRKIQAFGDRLRAKCGSQLGEQGSDYLDRMLKAAQRMQVLIQDLLKLSRVTSRAQPFEKCSLGEVVRDVLSDLELRIEQTGAKIEVSDLPVIDADPVQMRQLFQNLVGNALKFHKENEPPEVSISSRVFPLQERLSAAAEPGDLVCQIRVQDNGIGFDEQFADQIFIVFQRLHSREEYEGTGIGLAVCRKITDRHGGTIMAKSAPNQGACFTITLPIHQPSAANAAAPQ